MNNSHLYDNTTSGSSGYNEGRKISEPKNDKPESDYREEMLKSLDLVMLNQDELIMKLNGMTLPDVRYMLSSARRVEAWMRERVSDIESMEIYIRNLMTQAFSDPTNMATETVERAEVDPLWPSYDH